MKKLALFLSVLLFISNANAGPLAYGICQTGCNALVVACYAVSSFLLKKQ